MTEIDNPVPVNVFVVSALGALGERRAVEPLMRSLTHQDADVRWAAASALGEIGDPDALFALQEARHNDDDEVSWGGALVSEAAAAAIEQIQQQA